MVANVIWRTLTLDALALQNVSFIEEGSRTSSFYSSRPSRLLHKLVTAWNMIKAARHGRFSIVPLVVDRSHRVMRAQCRLVPLSLGRNHVLLTGRPHHQPRSAFKRSYYPALPCCSTTSSAIGWTGLLDADRYRTATAILA